MSGIGIEGMAQRMETMANRAEDAARVACDRAASLAEDFARRVREDGGVYSAGRLLVKAAEYAAKADGLFSEADALRQIVEDMREIAGGVPAE